MKWYRLLLLSSQSNVHYHKTGIKGLWGSKGVFYLKVGLLLVKVNELHSLTLLAQLVRAFACFLEQTWRQTSLSFYNKLMNKQFLHTDKRNFWMTVKFCDSFIPLLWSESYKIVLLRFGCSRFILLI